MTQQQVLGAVALMLIGFLGTNIWIARDTAIDNKKELENRAPFMTKADAELHAHQVKLDDLVRKVDRLESEFGYNKRDAETSSALIKENVGLLHRVELSLARIESGQKSLEKSNEAIHEELADMDQRLKKGGL